MLTNEGRELLVRSAPPESGLDPEYGTVPYVPKSGYVSVTIPTTVYAKLAAIAKEENNTVPRIIVNLVSARDKRKTGAR
ncbi:MAG TPA: hypothetical protein VNA15_02515 [Candidatus Angelobacter sp.]|nr:hypothetical protein [Candidatus Angelobacter sp.]